MIAADPGYWVRALTGQLLGEGAKIEPEVMEGYMRCFRDKGTLAASCADFRSGASTDLAHDDETFAAGHKVECPLLVLWGTQGMVGPGYDPPSIWQQYAADVRGHAVPPATSFPKRHRSWSVPPCAISSTRCIPRARDSLKHGVETGGSGRCLCQRPVSSPKA